MTKFIGTPLRGIEFANPGDEAISSRVSGDTQPRLRIDAGGRITWSDGTNSGDTVLFRSDANALTTYDSLTASAGLITLTTNGIPNQSLPNGAIAIDTTNNVFYFRSNNEWLEVSGGATVTVSDTAPVSPAIGDLWYSSLELELFIYYSNAWIQLTDAQGGVQELYELSDVLIDDPLYGQTLVYNGTEWENDFILTAQSLQTARAISLAGDVSGSVAFDGSQNVSISATIQPNSVALGTDTTGNYVNDLTAGTGVTVTHTPGEGSSPTVAIGQSVATSATPTFAGLNLNGNITFEGTTADDFETIIAITDPTSDRVIVFPDLTGTVVTTGDTGSITSLMIADGTIVNADINASAAIAHSKLANATAGQVLLGTTTTGVVTATTISGDITIDGAGVASIAANSVALGTDTTGNYMSGVSVQNGLTVSHTPGEGSSATIGVDNALLSNFLLDGASGNSYGLIGTSAYLDVKNTNGYNKEIELDIVALETKLTTDGYLKDSSTSASVSFARLQTSGDVVVGGDLTVNGTTTTLNTETLSIEDNIVVLNSNVTGSPTTNAGVEVERGTSNNVVMRWNESADRWDFTNDGSTYNNVLLLSDISQDSLNDTVITTPLTHQSITYNGTNWVNEFASTVTYARNVEDNALSVGEVVYLFGATGDRASVKRASNSSEATSSKTVGVVSVGGAAGADVTITTLGYVSGISLESYAAGDVLWLGSTAGTFTTTKPIAPAHLVFVGIVAKANAGNGIMYVKCQNGYEINELHDVKINGVTDGQFLRYNSASTVWVNDTINLGTDTVGDYMSDLTQGTGVTITHTPGEGSNATIAIGQNVSTSASVTFANVTSTGNVAISGRIDKTTIRESVADTSVSASVVTADYATGDIFYVDTAPSSNFTVNLTNAPTDDGKAITVVLFVTQGATGYYPNVVQVAGSAQTIKWANGAAPTPTSSAGKIDIFSFTFVRRSAAWTVFGSSNLGY